MRTIVWFAYFWAYLVCLIPAMHKAQRFAQEGKTAECDAIINYEMPKWAKRLMKLAGVTVKVEGRENIPDEPVVFVSNHQGYFDIPILLTYLDKPHGLVAKNDIEKMPLVRSWMKLLGCVFIDRSNARQSLTQLGVAADALTEQGRSFIIFPEGTRSRGGPLGDFKSGAFRIATKTGAPILPICIDGTYRAMEAQGGWIRPAEVKLTILPPIPTKDMTREETKLIGEQVRTLINDKIFNA